MSTVLALANDATVHTATYLSAAGDQGVIDFLTTKNSQTQTLLRALAVTIGLIFVIMQAISSRGAMARVIVAIAAAGVFIWGTWNITDVKDRVDNEVTSGLRAAAAQTHNTVASPITASARS